jgi:hypothetical protein
VTPARRRTARKGAAGSPQDNLDPSVEPAALIGPIAAHSGERPQTCGHCASHCHPMAGFKRTDDRPGPCVRKSKFGLETADAVGMAHDRQTIVRSGHRSGDCANLATEALTETLSKDRSVRISGLARHEAKAGIPPSLPYAAPARWRATRLREWPEGAHFEPPPDRASVRFPQTAAARGGVGSCVESMYIRRRHR